MTVTELLALPSLPPGRKILTCCIPGCTNREIMNDDALRVICHHHAPTHNFPRDIQWELPLAGTPTAALPQ